MSTDLDLGRAVSLHQSGKYEQAEKGYRELLDKGKATGEVYYYLADCLLKQNKVFDAMATAERGITVDPNKPELHTFLGQMYWTADKKDKAVECYEVAAKLGKPDATTMYNLGNMYYEVGRNGDALDSFMKALKINPKLHQAFNNVGVLHIEAESWENAIEYLQKALQYERKHVNANKHIGIAFEKTGKLKDAGKHYKMALQNAKTNESKIELSLLAGKLHAVRGNNDLAVQSFENVLKLDADNGEAKEQLDALSTAN